MTSLSAQINVNVKNRYDRVVVLIDMDCFYCQVEEKLNADLAGKPIAVVQYNAWQGGGIIAVNYTARAKGVTRHMKGEEAQQLCPEINLVRVPNVREKADLTKYREAGKRVAEVLQTFTPLFERASVDEAYLDITEQVKFRLAKLNDGTYKILANSLENTFSIGYESIGLFVHEISLNQLDAESELPEFHENETSNLYQASTQKYNLKLLIGAAIVSEIRAKVREKTGYECSAGIAHNKILAKLACAINKPNKQTILSINETSKFLQSLAVHKIKGLGGKFGEDIVEELRIKTIGNLLQYSKTDLQKKYGEKSGNWLFLIARGIDLESVTPKFYSKSIGCSKKFPGRNAITGINTLNHWLNELANEIADRLDKDIIENNRKANQMVVSFVQEINANDVSSSRTANLLSYDPDIISKTALDILQKNTSQFFKQDSTKNLYNPIKFLGISVGKFENISSGQSTLHEMFSKQKKIVEDKLLDENLLVNKYNDNASTSKNSHQTKIGSVIESNGENEFLTTKVFELTESSNIARNFVRKIPNNLETIVEPKKYKNEYSFKNLFDSQIKSLNNKIDNTESQKELAKPEILEEDKEMREISHFHSLASQAEEPSTSPDYTKTYAEYAIIQQSGENIVKCPECGNNVLCDNFQSHLDRHLAFKLSQQLREEYRNELRSQFSQNIIHKQSKDKKIKELNNSVTSAYKNISKTKKSVTSPLGNITKYLKPSKKSSTDNKNNLVKCSECGCSVDELKVLEHKDLHLAQKIQREWNTM